MTEEHITGGEGFYGSYMPPRNVKSLFPPNETYGSEYVIRTFANWRDPICAVIPTELNLERSWIEPAEREVPLPAVLSWPPHCDMAYAQFKKAIPSCAPFVYAVAMTSGNQNKAPLASRRGTVVVPFYAPNGQTDWKAMAEGLKDLEPPVRVCLHDHDLKENRHQFFEGYQVISPGPVKEKEYLFRLANLFREVRWVASNRFSSIALYALMGGASYFNYGPAPIVDEHNRSEEGLAKEQELYSMFVKREIASVDLHEWAFDVLGGPRFRPPQELHRVLEECENMAVERFSHYVRKGFINRLRLTRREYPRMVMA